MPADDLVLNVRQIAGYTPTSSVVGSDQLVLQRGGLGGPYLSIDAADFVGTALSGGGAMAVNGPLTALSVSGGSAQFSNASVGVLGAQSACIGNLTANFGSINGDPILTASALAAFAAQNVRSFNMRFGDIMLTVDDIICAGGAPIFSPIFSGTPRAETPPPWSNSSRIATTAFVQMAFGGFVEGYAPLASPAFSGVPTAPTPPQGSSDGQLATTAFVMNAVADSVTGVVSFNTRTGAVVLTGPDINAAGGAMLASPAFTGAPAAPTAVPGTATTQLATCAFVAAAVAAVAAGVSSFNGRNGVVTLTTADVAAVGVSAFNGRIGSVNLIANDVSAVGAAMLASPNFTGMPTGPTAAPGSTTTQLATCAFVAAAIATVSGVSSFNGRTGAVALIAADVTGVGGALLAGPTFTGTPQAPTATAGTNTTQLATCAFVLNAVSAATAGVATFNGRTGAVTLIANDITGAGGALLASPAFTGVPQAPTATAGTNTTQLATCAFVAAAIAAVNVGVVTFNGRAGAVTLTTADVSAAGGPYLPLAGGTLSGALTIGSTGLAITSAGGTAHQVLGQTAGSNRWVMQLGDGTAESGSDAGSNFALNACHDSGVSFANVLAINRANHAATFGSTVQAIGGYVSQAGTGGATGNSWYFFWNGTNLQCWIGASNIGNVTISSDYRIKREVEPLPSMWDQAKALNPIRYKFRDYTPAGVRAGGGVTLPIIVGDDVERWGFIAHELQETLIEDAATGVKDAPASIQSPNPWTVIATLTKALQEAMTRIEALEAA